MRLLLFLVLLVLPKGCQYSNYVFQYVPCHLPIFMYLFTLSDMSITKCSTLIFNTKKINPMSVKMTFR